jgi:DNA-binding CsgD family transcriptional regulator
VEGVRAVVGFERLEPSDSRPDQLSNRELEVLSYLPTMLTASEIATQLYVSVNTIEAHVKSIYLKLGVPAAGRRRPGIRRWHPLARPFVPPADVEANSAPWTELDAKAECRQNPDAEPVRGAADQRRRRLHHPVRTARLPVRRRRGSRSVGR